jgi:hypothetical protein
MGQEDDPYTNAEIEALPLGSDRRSEMRDANFNHDESRMFTPLSIGFIVVGVLSGITGAFMLKYQPVKSYEARKLADKHNKNLKKKLGLDNNYIPEKTSNKIDFKFSIAPYAGKNTGGLLLNVDF